MNKKDLVSAIVGVGVLLSGVQAFAEQVCGNIPISKVSAANQVIADKIEILSNSIEFLQAQGASQNNTVDFARKGLGVAAFLVAADSVILSAGSATIPGGIAALLVPTGSGFAIMGANSLGQSLLSANETLYNNPVALESIVRAALDGVPGVETVYNNARNEINAQYFKQIEKIKANVAWYHLGQDELAEAKLDALVTEEHLKVDVLEKRFLIVFRDQLTNYCNSVTQTNH